MGVNPDILEGNLTAGLMNNILITDYIQVPCPPHLWAFEQNYND